ncbi:MAG: hypothetical protein EBQ57_09285, partial [Actinobacteria bacterium]|nr:hypothetical protein [Actinomycetota bacterium]
MAVGINACSSSKDGSSLASPSVSTKNSVQGSDNSTPASIIAFRATMPLRILVGSVAASSNAPR